MSYLLWQDISFYLSEIDREKEVCETSSVNAGLMEGARKTISQLFEQLKGVLEQKLSKEHTSLILFALIAAIDEEMQKVHYHHLKTSWSPLMKDFYSAYTAGEVFFKTIDDILDNTSIPTIVYEVFYFMLKRGFQGKYRESRTQLLKYSDLLRQKIPVKLHDPKIIATETPSLGTRKNKMKKQHYYLLASSLAIVVYAALLILSQVQ